MCYPTHPAPSHNYLIHLHIQRHLQGHSGVHCVPTTATFELGTWLNMSVTVKGQSL